MRADHRVLAGDTFTMAITADSGLAAASLRCTIKRRRNDSDDSAIAVVTEDEGAIDVASDTSAVVTFDADLTREWPATALWYDVQAVDGGGEVFTLAHGFVLVQQRVTLARLYDDPHLIFGDDLAFWFHADDFEDHGGLAAADWPSTVGAEAIGAFDVARSPAAAAGIGGLPTVLADGVDDVLGTAMAEPFAVGSRPYFAMLMRAESLTFSAPSGGFLGELFTTFRATPSFPGAITPFRLGIWAFNDTTGDIDFPGPGVTNRWLCSFNLSSVVYGDAESHFHSRIGAAYDTEPHIIEMGLVDALDGHFRIDGVAQDALYPGYKGDLSSPVVFTEMGSFVMLKHQDAQDPVSRGMHVHVRHFVGVRRIPTARERARLYAWMEWQKTHA